MQLSPSTVPSDSNALAGIFPVGAPVVAAEGGGLPEPAEFAELMAALAPATATTLGALPVLAGASVTSRAVPTQAPTVVSRGVAGVDLRVPGMAVQIEGDTARYLEGTQDEVPPDGVSEIEAISIPSATPTAPAWDEEHLVERSRVREPRRSLHEPVAGLETMVVPQMPVAPTPVAEPELEEEAAELDTEEAPVDEDGPGNEQAAEDIAPTAPRDLARMPSPAFTDVLPEAAGVQPAATVRRVSAPMVPSAIAATSHVAPPEALPALGTVAAPSSAVAERSQVAPALGQGASVPSVTPATRPAGMAPAVEIAATPLPTPLVAVTPVVARQMVSRVETTLSEKAPTLTPVRDPITTSQPGVVDVSTRMAAVEVQAVLPARPIATEPMMARAVVAPEADAPVIPASTAMVPVEAIAAASATKREVGPRVVAPRVAAAYAVREKFAAERTPSVNAQVTPHYSGKISFLSTDDEMVNAGSYGVGTDVAKPVAVMPAPSSPITSAALAPVAMSVGDVASSSAQEADDVSAPAAVSNAEQAVEVVLRAVDTAADREQKVVKLEFSVGDADLSVRVELADNEVRTTFHTESHELRAALAHEWQSVSAETADQGGVRLAPAVISDREPSTSTSADANSQRQERQAARQEEAAASSHQAAARSLLRSTAAADSVAEPASASRALAPAGTAQRLHLFA